MSGISYLETELKMPGGFVLPVRTTVVRLGDATILISPGSRVPEDQLKVLGRVTDIVAPNLGHAAGFPRAVALFPEARLWGPAGVEKKYPTLKWTGTLGVTPWPYQDELPLLAVDGIPAMREFLLLHRPSRTLIATDLVFNMVEAKGLLGRILFGLLGTWRRLAVSRVLTMLTKDRAALKRSLRPLIDADFDNIAPGHGALVSGDGKARLLAALRERGLVD